MRFQPAWRFSECRNNDKRHRNQHLLIFTTSIQSFIKLYIKKYRNEIFFRKKKTKKNAGALETKLSTWSTFNNTTVMKCTEYVFILVIENHFPSKIKFRPYRQWHLSIWQAFVKPPTSSFSTMRVWSRWKMSNGASSMLCQQRSIAPKAANDGNTKTTTTKQAPPPLHVCHSPPPSRHPAGVSAMFLALLASTSLEKLSRKSRIVRCIELAARIGAYIIH